MNPKKGKEGKRRKKKKPFCNGRKDISFAFLTDLYISKFLLKRRLTRRRGQIKGAENWHRLANTAQLRSNQDL